MSTAQPIELVAELTYGDRVFKLLDNVTVNISKRDARHGRIELLHSNGWVGIDVGNGEHVEGFFADRLERH